MVNFKSVKLSALDAGQQFSLVGWISEREYKHRGLTLYSIIQDFSNARGQTFARCSTDNPNRAIKSNKVVAIDPDSIVFLVNHGKV